MSKRALDDASDRDDKAFKVPALPSKVLKVIFRNVVISVCVLPQTNLLLLLLYIV
jgi:hypothetical protein